MKRQSPASTDESDESDKSDEIPLLSRLDKRLQENLMAARLHLKSLPVRVVRRYSTQDEWRELLAKEDRASIRERYNWNEAIVEDLNLALTEKKKGEERESKRWSSVQVFELQIGSTKEEKSGLQETLVSICLPKDIASIILGYFAPCGGTMSVTYVRGCTTGNVPYGMLDRHLLNGICSPSREWDYTLFFYGGGAIVLNHYGDVRTVVFVSRR